MWTIVASIVATLVVVVLVINFRTPEKKIQHQVRHLYPVAHPQFEREMGALLGPAIVPGNAIVVLQNGDEIFPAMLSAIRAAQSTINFETYIYWSGRTSEEFADALMERARAGIKVHLMLDWLGTASRSTNMIRPCSTARP